MSILSIRSQIQPLEHVPGYLVRLAKENGFSGIEQLFYKTEFLALIRGRGKKYEECCIKFGINIPKQDTSHALASTTVRVCPECVAQLDLIKAEWHSTAVYHCKIHSLALIDTCEHCQMQLRWDIPLLKGLCTNPNCGRQLPESLSTMTEKEHHSAYQCWLAGYWCMHNTSITRFETISIKMMQEIGYAFLSSPITALHYLDSYQSLMGRNILPQNIKKLSLHHLRIQLTTPWHTLKHIDKFLALPLQSDEFNPDSVMLSVSDLCKTMGVDRQTVSRLIFDGYALQPVNRWRVTPDTALNVAPLFKALVTKSTTLADGQTVADFRYLIEAYFQSNSTLLLACLNGELEFQYQPGESLFDSIQVAETDLRLLLASGLDAIRDRAIRLEEIERLTGLSQGAIRHAIKSGKLKREARERFDYNQTLFLSEARTLLKMNTRQAELELWG